MRCGVRAALSWPLGRPPCRVSCQMAVAAVGLMEEGLLQGRGMWGSWAGELATVVGSLRTQLGFQSLPRLLLRT